MWEWLEFLWWGGVIEGLKEVWWLVMEREKEDMVEREVIGLRMEGR